MKTVVLDGSTHSHEHFRFKKLPSRISIQSKEKNSGMYRRDRDKVSIYQDTGRYANGCRVYNYVRSSRTTIQGFVETSYS